MIQTRVIFNRKGSYSGQGVQKKSTEKQKIRQVPHWARDFPGRTRQDQKYQHILSRKLIVWLSILHMCGTQAIFKSPGGIRIQ